MMMRKKKRDRTHEKCGGFKVVKLESRVIRGRERERERVIRKKNERESDAKERDIA